MSLLTGALSNHILVKKKSHTIALDEKPNINNPKQQKLENNRILFGSSPSPL